MPREIQLKKRWRGPSNQIGFTLIEVTIVVFILGILLAVGALSYVSIRKGMNMSGAKKQVEEAMQRAKTVARQENITYRLVFYPGETSSPSTYEFYSNVEDPTNPGSWQMVPVNKSVTGETVSEEDGHWYIQVPHGVRVTNEQTTITFTPKGMMMIVTPAATINLQIGDVNSSVSISDDGTISVD